MSKKYDVMVISGKYKDRDGVERSRYLNIGAVVESRNGPMLKLDSIPVEWDGWAYLNEPREWPESRREPRSSDVNTLDSSSDSENSFNDPPF